MNLIVEIGNSNRKIAIFDGDQMVYKRTYPVELASSLSKELHGHDFKKAILSGSGNIEWTDWESLQGNKYVFQPDMLSEIHIQYLTPETLGHDRLISTYMASVLFPGMNQLVIDCGTCITFSFLDRENNYLGGSISPGLSMRFKSLNEYTHRLPWIKMNEGRYENHMGVSTEGNMISGVWMGCIYEINGRMDDYKKNYKDLNIIMTGGDSHFFENKIKSEIFADPDLTLKGLNQILNKL